MGLPTGLDPGIQVEVQAWAELVERHVLNFSVMLPGAGGFTGGIDSLPLLDTRILLINCGPHSAERGTRDIRPGATTYCLVCFQLSGRLHLSQFGRATDVLPGDFNLFTSDAPVRIDSSPNHRSVGVRIPMSRLRIPPDQMHELAATTFDAGEGLARVLKSLLIELHGEAPRLHPSQLPGLSHHITGLVELLLRERLPHPEPDHGGTHALTQRCLTYIEDNLGDPDLHPARVAAAAFISTRYLHRIFRSTGTTVARYIRSRRLERIREDLGDPLLASDSIEQVVRRWGMTNSSYVGQVFRAVEGCTPTQYRRAALGDPGDEVL
ncbi:helix-turn-helix domain-containing protein [Corynebacterium pacaense]|uniref:AraC-like ligand-binding domain-containing protein n=1 Tax=Corynebacterium pacaense TaxID=1816684 RepID=UPI0009BB2788|nr:helix-turn-helix domain-containing protein [Corynebacterium pacaense]